MGRKVKQGAPHFDKAFIFELLLCCSNFLFVGDKERLFNPTRQRLRGWYCLFSCYQSIACTINWNLVTHEHRFGCLLYICFFLQWVWVEEEWYCMGGTVKQGTTQLEFMHIMRMRMFNLIVKCLKCRVTTWACCASGVEMKFFLQRMWVEEYWYCTQEKVQHRTPQSYIVIVEPILYLFLCTYSS